MLLDEELTPTPLAAVVIYSQFEVVRVSRQ
jgi:hypothetical protein